MKCAGCGAKMKPGCVYCSVCGREAQIVPDYNMEEDYLKSLLQEKKKPKQKKEGEETEKKEERKLVRKGVYAGVLVFAAVAVLIIGAVVLVKSRSYEGRLRKAEKAYENKGYQQAADYAKQALEKNRKGQQALLILGKCYLAQKNPEKAEEYLELAFSSFGEDEEICKLLIQIYDQKGDYRAITTLYSRVKKKELQDLFADYLLEAPVIRPEAGAYGEYPEIEMEAPREADIYYTIDGKDPKTDGMVYRRPFLIKEEGEIRIRAFCEDVRGIQSPETESVYQIALEVPELPTAFPGSGTYPQGTMITIEVPAGCQAYYAWNGVPGRDTACYTGPFEMIPGNNVLSVILINSSGRSSGVQKYNYIYMP